MSDLYIEKRWVSMLGPEEEGGESMLSGWGHGNRRKQQSGSFSCPGSTIGDERNVSEEKRERESAQERL